MPSENNNLPVNKRLKEILVILMISYLLIISIELVLRIKAVNEQPAFENNESYLVSLRPNIIKKYTRSAINGGVDIVWRTNSDSFRGGELSNKHDMRIMIYGDSNIQARFSNIENTFPQRLDYYLTDYSNNDVEVINAGIVGHGPDQSYLRFLQDAPVYFPDVVVFNIFADNDFGDLIRNGLFKIGKNGDLEEIPVKDRKDVVLQELYSRSSFDYRFYNLKFFFSELAELRHKYILPETEIAKNSSKDKSETIRRLQKMLTLIEDQYNKYESGHYGYYSNFTDVYDIDVAINIQEDIVNTKKRLMEKILISANQFANDNDIVFVVLIQPSSVDLTSNSSILKNRDMLMVDGYDAKNISSAIETICKANGIRYLNLFDEFYRNKPSLLYFNGSNNHWNDAGQDLAASLLSQYMLDNILAH